MVNHSYNYGVYNYGEYMSIICWSILIYFLTINDVFITRDPLQPDGCKQSVFIHISHLQ